MLVLLIIGISLLIDPNVRDNSTWNLLHNESWHPCYVPRLLSEFRELLFSIQFYNQHSQVEDS